MYRLSNVSKDYLVQYVTILEKMKKGMMEVVATNSLSHDFILQMIPHHEAAIEMSHNLLHYTTDIALQDIGLNIIKEQTESIASMTAILQSCTQQVNSKEELLLYQEQFLQITNIMFHDMTYASAVNNINVDFIGEMIPHHRGAIDMCKNLLRFPICNALIPIATSIITAQEKGIQELEAIYNRLVD